MSVCICLILVHMFDMWFLVFGLAAWHIGDSKKCLAVDN